MQYWSLLLILLIISIESAVAQKTFYDQNVSNWQDTFPPDDTSRYHSVILTSNTGAGKSLELLQTKLNDAPNQTSLLVLGDMVSPHGLPVEESHEYDSAKKQLATMLQSIATFEGKVVLLPGHSDWDNGGKDGFERVVNEQKYIQAVTQNPNIYQPQNGCPGPVELPLAEDIVAIIFDSNWWFHKYKKPGPEDDCDFEDIAGLLIQTEDIIRRNEGKKIIFATHHPLFSVGNHGGYFHPSRWVFPLLDINDNLYLPLPGFLYTGYRKYLGAAHDLVHPDYKSFRTMLLNIFDEYPNIIYAAGHEQNLQYVQQKNLHHIISGNGANSYIASNSKKADFATEHSGISILNFYDNGDVWAEFWSNEKKQGELVFRHKLFNQTMPDIEEIKIARAQVLSDSTVRVKISEIYNRGNFVKFWIGEGYRKDWNQEVTFPVFDIRSEKGGFKILKRGGGMQSRSIRMENPDGKQYVLRSADKNAAKLLEPELQNTIAQYTLQDAISSSTPYGALTVPKLADAAGIMHTNPRLVYVPDDPALGIYRKDMANDVFLFEERPAGNREDVASFGFSKKIQSTPKTIEKTQEEHDHIVVQDKVVRARLFDILLGDWDRHDDQWRWATLKKDGTTYYEPIPRDRDQVYYVNEGVATWFVGLDFVLPKFQGFHHKIRNVNGFGFNARHFDRTFLTEPDRDVWMQTAAELQESITDSVIHDAISDLPDEIYALSGEKIESKLRSRRNDLNIYADQYYHYLAQAVDVVGTEDRDLFNVKRLENGNTDISVHALSQKKAKVQEQIYHREFKPDETKEIRLYGLQGDDKFEIDGSASNAIKVRVIGGKGKDTFIDNSNVNGLRKTVLVYDRKDKKNDIQKGDETKLKLSHKKSINSYDRYQFEPNNTMPLLAGGYNIDDGIYIGGGINAKRYNFRDSTFHRLTGSLALETKAFAIKYNGYFSAFSDYFELELPIALSMPRSVDNFFGLGNETKKVTENKSYHRVRYQYGNVNPTLKRAINKNISYKLGLFYQYYSVQDTTNRFIGHPGASGLEATAYEPHHFGGVNAALEIDTRNSSVLPQRGLHWITEANGFYGLDELSKNVVQLKTDMSFYLSLTSDPRFILALRCGGATNIGSYEFFHANALGGKSNLRGYRARRFAGDHSVYQNTELRFKLFNIHSMLFNGQSGILLFHDIGRVWVDDENSNIWHNGYGFGFWLTPFEFTAISLNFNTSDDDSMITFKLNFLY